MTPADSPFDQENLDRLLPPSTSDRFFEALLGDSREGAYDIRLCFNSRQKDRLEFEFQLIRRPGKCLACSLTYGLPRVFSRHPVIDAQNLARRLIGLLDKNLTCAKWRFGRTREISRRLHVVPFTIIFEAAA